MLPKIILVLLQREESYWKEIMDGFQKQIFGLQIQIHITLVLTKLILMLVMPIIIQGFN